jgi:predicted RNA-binding protein
MFQAEIKWHSTEGEETIMKDVIRMQVDGEMIRLSHFFEEPVSVHASVIEVDFLKHTVILAPTNEENRTEE